MKSAKKRKHISAARMELWRCYNCAIEDGFNPETGFIVEEDELDKD
jgi:hypothetical protein